MNKVKIGKYLQSLREKAGLTRTEAANQLGTIYKSILDWESGVMPADESLLDLAKLYKVTVDDILECGQQITNEELYEKYPVFKPLDYNVKLDKKVDYYTPYQSTLIIVNERLKELILLFRKKILSRNEDFELRFLFNNMCGFSSFYYEKYENEHKDKYLCFIEVLNDCKSTCKTAPEYYFEVKKYIDVVDKGYHCPYPEYGNPEKDPLKDQQFKSLENWQKDFYLALIQNDDVIFDPACTPSHLKDYEQRYGEQFDKEAVIKRLIKYFIKNGAELNPWLFSFVKKNKVERNVLITLEELYIDYMKPIFIQFHNPNNEEDKEYKYAFVENNEANRYLDDYHRYYLPVYTTERIDPKRMFDLLVSADEETIVDYLYSMRKRFRNVEETEYRFKKADVESDLERFYKCREKLFEDRRVANKSINQIKELEEKLQNGETVFYEYELEDISNGKDFNHWSLMTRWKNKLSYYQFLKKRDHKMTLSLLGEIDNLSLDEIRNKYFEKEVVE